MISECGLTTHQITSQTENTELALKNFESGVCRWLRNEILDEGGNAGTRAFCASRNRNNLFKGEEGY